MFLHGEGHEADMPAKHVNAMTADKGADKKTQQRSEKFAGGMFKASERTAGIGAR